MGILIIIVVLSLWRGDKSKTSTRTELYNTDSKTKPDGLAKLPTSYDKIPKLEPGKVKVGDALKKVGKDSSLPPKLSFKSQGQTDLEHAERARLARLAQKGRESGLFFRIRLKTPLNGQGKAKGSSSPSSPSLSGQLTALSRLAGGPNTNVETHGLPTDSDKDSGRQRRKLAFLKTKLDDKIYNKHGLQQAVSPYQLMAGTIISASLLTGLNSDLPGQVMAQVTEHVYDSVTGQHILIPQGSRLIGKYDSVVAFGQERALVIWQRIILPDGSSVVIENLPATDPSGYAGLQDEVDFHDWKLVKGIALSTLLGVGTELTFDSAESDLLKAIRESTQSSANQAGQKIVQRNLDIQPSIKIRPGWPLRIIVNKDIILKPYKIEETAQ